MKIHLRDQRLFINAGLIFPSCTANAPLLDLDKARLRISGDIKKVTCKHCIKVYNKRMERMK